MTPAQMRIRAHQLAQQANWLVNTNTNEQHQVFMAKRDADAVSALTGLAQLLITLAALDDAALGDRAAG